MYMHAGLLFIGETFHLGAIIQCMRLLRTGRNDALEIMRCFKRVVMINQGQEEARDWMHARVSLIN